ncbi:hypothetical protein WEU38_00435 [Cyanobacterium aponinum AL20118]|uniref:Uncharacterized protein n=1 Tax=Cyanobacterium aponinum AL20115 TaxID=3090662 RepID=A0AAF0ZEH6_9CHRO|nr:hypothetical protein [Cyanobacterium aponinum]WPF88775.1 hypothetical protein SAY89_00440 [Cyanobacterium aponinum AL20115]
MKNNAKKQLILQKDSLSSIKCWFLSRLLNTDSEKGYVLVIAIALLFGLASLVLVYARSSRIEQVSNTAAVDSTSGFYGAEAALNERANEITKIYQSNSVPSGTSPESTMACFDNSISDGTGDYQCKTYQFSGGDSERSGYSATTYVLEKNEGVGNVGNVPPGDNHAGLNMIEYGHSIIALAFKDSDVQQRQQQGSGQGRGAIAILQMDIKNRLIPLFQFAAFYKDDLEIFPGATMTLSGPVHTNGDLYIGNQLAVDGDVTTAGEDLFASKGNDSAKKGNNPSPVSPSNYNSQVKTPFTITDLRVGIDPLGLPEPDFLNSSGEYFTKADIRIKFTPTGTNQSTYGEDIPFTIEVIERTQANNSPVSAPVAVSLTSAQRHSLRQPILVSEQLASIPSSSESFSNSTSNKFYSKAQNPDFSTCKPIYKADFSDMRKNIKSAFPSTWNSLTPQQKRDAAQFAHQLLVTRVQEEESPLKFTDLDLVGNNGVDGLTFTNIPNIPSSLQTNLVAKLNSLTANEIAALPYPDASGNTVQRCFAPAPLTDIGRDASNHNKPPFRFFNNRENDNNGRDMRLLQINIKSLTIWNYEGIYLDGSQLKSANQLLFKTAPADNKAPANSFQALGMAARDTSDDGLVMYLTIDSNSYTNAGGNTSPYGFAIVEGNQLPGLGSDNAFNLNDPTGLTIASDQAVYLQGDYNTRNKQPASILSDSLNVLSNKCFDPNKVINKENNMNCNDSTKNNNNSLGNALQTVMNVAFLAGNDETKGSQYNGGLENYPRLHESWSGIPLRYRGSFVSLGTPNHVNGKWPGTGGKFYNAPNRQWDYDTEFNDAKNLPPLTPRFSAMKQESFIRSFDQ